MSNFGEQPSQQGSFYQNGSVGAGFLAAVAADTAVVVVPGWLGPVTFIPVNGFGADGTHLDADSAEVAP